MTFSYRPYILVSAQLDSDVSRRHSSSGSIPDKQKGPDGCMPLWHTIRDFAAHCQSWHERHERMWEAWKAGRGTRSQSEEEAKEDREAESENALFTWLNKPVCYFPISGHSDGFGLVAFDSLDASSYLGSVSAKTVEDLTVLLAPDMDTIREEVGKRLPQASTTLLGTLKNVDDLFQGAEFAKSTDGTIQLPTALEKRPLLAYSRCKLEGMLALDLAGWVVDAILPSLGVCMVRKLEQMLQGLAGANGEKVQRLYKQEDIENCAITFLHSQGTNELCILIHGTNLTVAAALLSTARELRLDNIQDSEFDGISWIKKWLDEGRSARFSIPGKDKTDPKWDWEIGDCFRGVGYCLSHANFPPQEAGQLPVFRWTLTSTCMVSDGVGQQNWDKISGWLRLHAFLQVTPASRGKDFNSSISCGARAKIPDSKDYRLHLQGLYDVLKTLECQDQDGEFTGSLIYAPDAIQWLINQHKDLSSNANPHFVGIQSMVSIPVPVGVINERQHEVAVSWGVDKVLAKVRQEFMGNVKKLQTILDEIRGNEDKNLPQKEYDWHRLLANAAPQDGEGTGIYRLLRTQFLEVIPRLYGLPGTLQESVACLFHQYICAVTNAHLFDLVADLLDSFATLHHVICQIFPRDLWRRKHLGLTRPLNPEIAQRMAHYVSALHRALDHRIQRAYPDSPLRDMAVDLRGDVYGFIQMAEAPLKCGVGLVANENSIWAKNQPHRRRDLLGVFTQIGVTAGIKAVYQNLGVEKRARLAYFASDIPHLMLVGSYVDYLHEAAHVAFETLISHHEEIREHYAATEKGRSPKKQEELAATIETLRKLAAMPESGSSLVAKKRMSELFVHSLTYKLLCPAEQKLFLRFFISRFSADPENAGYPLVQTIHRFAEVFSVLYLGSYCLWEDEQGTWQKRKVEDFFESNSDQKSTFDVVLAEMLSWYGPYEHLKTEREKKAVREFVTAYFRSFLKQVLNPTGEAPDINAILDLALFAFSSYAEKIVPASGAKDQDCDIEIARRYSQKRKDYLSNRPKTETHLREIQTKVMEGQSIYSYFIPPKGDLTTINPMLICGMLLRAYLEDLSDKSLEKTGKSRGRVNVFDIHQPLGHGIDRNEYHHDYVLYHGNASRTYIAPHKRRKRTLRQIAVMRSFWNLAAVIKGRRFCDLIRFADLLEDETTAAS